MKQYGGRREKCLHLQSDPPQFGDPRTCSCAPPPFRKCKISLALNHAHMYCTVWKTKWLWSFEFKLYQIVDTKSKWFFQANVSSKEGTNEFYFTTMKPQADLFLFCFWRKLKTPKRHFEINWPLMGEKKSWMPDILLLFGSFFWEKILLWNF